MNQPILDADITTLVHRFYARVRTHATLAPVFLGAIAPDDWPAHLAKMEKFWSSVMLASGAYSGNPVAAHRQVAGLQRALFPQWLALFEATAHDCFADVRADAFIDKARRIAFSLELAVFHNPRVLDATPMPA